MRFFVSSNIETILRSQTGHWLVPQKDALENAPVWVMIVVEDLREAALSDGRLRCGGTHIDRSNARWRRRQDMSAFRAGLVVDRARDFADPGVTTSRDGCPARSHLRSGSLRHQSMRPCLALLTGVGIQRSPPHKRRSQAPMGEAEGYRAGPGHGGEPAGEPAP
jgi:hypothetical protein